MELVNPSEGGSNWKEGVACMAGHCKGCMDMSHTEVGGVIGVVGKIG